MANFSRLKAGIGLMVMLLAATFSCCANDWSDELLGLTGTSIVFDNADVQQALQTEQTRPDLEQLLQKTGMKPWAGARIWVVQLADNKIQPFSAPPQFVSEANHRGLLLNTTLNDGDKITLANMLTQPKISWDNLQKLLISQNSDALVLINSKNNVHFWQLFSPPQRFTGSLASEGFDYLPHIWSENLAMSWQWPELKQQILVRIDGISQLKDFKAAEKALESACLSVQALRVSANSVDFACRSSNQFIPDKLSLVPQLVAKPIVSKGVDAATMMGRQLAQRYVIYQWRADVY